MRHISSFFFFVSLSALSIYYYRTTPLPSNSSDDELSVQLDADRWGLLVIFAVCAGLTSTLWLLAIKSAAARTLRPCFPTLCQVSVASLQVVEQVSFGSLCSSRR
jgi:hypothetical protein